jgi:hypothetical protein
MGYPYSLLPRNHVACYTNEIDYIPSQPPGNVNHIPNVVKAYFKGRSPLVESPIERLLSSFMSLPVAPPQQS